MFCIKIFSTMNNHSSHFVIFPMFPQYYYNSMLAKYLAFDTQLFYSLFLAFFFIIFSQSFFLNFFFIIIFSPTFFSTFFFIIFSLTFLLSFNSLCHSSLSPFLTHPSLFNLLRRLLFLHLCPNVCCSNMGKCVCQRPFIPVSAERNSRGRVILLC